MGTSITSRTVAAAYCLGLLLSPAAFADSEGWLERIGSVTSGFIPDINLSEYLDSSAANDDQVILPPEGELIAPIGAYLLQFELDNQLQITTVVDTGFHYTLLASDREDLGRSAGIYLLSMDPNIHSKVGGLARSAVAETRFPTFGVDLAYTLAPRWSLGMRGYFLDIETSELNGSQSAYAAGIEYAALEEMNVGFGFEQFEMQGDTQLENFPGYVAYKYSGPRIYTTLRF